MSANGVTARRPLWLAIEGMILEASDQGFAAEKQESTIQQLAAELDAAGYQVSHNAGNMLQLRWAMDARLAVGRPLLQDLNAAVAALTLDEVADPGQTSMRLIGDVGRAWPRLRDSLRQPDILRIIEQARLDLLIARAKELAADQGIRYLLAENLAPAVITSALGISDEQFSQVKAAVAAEGAERKRVAGLLEAVAESSAEDRIKHLITSKVADELIVEMAAVELAAVHSAKQAMAAELQEQQRLADEAAAAKAAAAAGPPLEDIPADEMLEYIESIREILEFSDQEEEIRTMCGQSDIPTSLVDVAVSDPDKLDELEAKAEG
jgi:hypothetical protein